MVNETKQYDLIIKTKRKCYFVTTSKKRWAKKQIRFISYFVPVLRLYKKRIIE